ncbi:hypothetical protein J6590_011789 [Homalodisca vitripennis]|nr:hypothetical protein J6590_011789 [Homalodisca vitripennis]
MSSARSVGGINAANTGLERALYFHEESVRGINAANTGLERALYFHEELCVNVFSSLSYNISYHTHYVRLLVWYSLQGITVTICQVPGV